MPHYPGKERQQQANRPGTISTISFSIPPEMSERVDQVMKQQGCSRIEFIQKAVLRYIQECAWGQLLQFGEDRATAKGIGPEDMAGLVDEYRAELSSSRT